MTYRLNAISAAEPRKELAQMMTFELEAKERAAEVVAAYLGRWRVPTTCAWETLERDAMTLDADITWRRCVVLRVNGEEVWSAQWMEGPRFVFTLRIEWAENWLAVLRRARVTPLL